LVEESLLPEPISDVKKNKKKKPDNCVMWLFKKCFSTFWPKEPRYIVIMSEADKKTMVDNFFLEYNHNDDDHLDKDECYALF
jgi:hypothetical protein